MPKYNPLDIRTQPAPISTLTHSQQPLGIITTSIPSTQGQYYRMESTPKGNSIVQFTGCF